MLLMEKKFPQVEKTQVANFHVHVLRSRLTPISEQDLIPQMERDASSFKIYRIGMAVDQGK